MCTNHANKNLCDLFGPSTITNQTVDGQSIDIIFIREKLKCIIESIDEAVKDSKVNDIWHEAKKQLGYVSMRMKACRTEQTIKDEIK